METIELLKRYTIKDCELALNYIIVNLRIVKRNQTVMNQVKTTNVSDKAVIERLNHIADQKRKRIDAIRTKVKTLKLEGK